MSNVLKLIEYNVKTDRRGRRGHPAIKAGQLVYVLRHLRTGKYFVWAYLDKEMAQMIEKKIPAQWRETDLDFNFKSNIEHCVHTHTKIGG